MSEQKISEQKISEESARAQLRVFEEFYEIELGAMQEESGMIMSLVVKSIQRGRIEIRERDGKVFVVQHLKTPPGDIREIEYGVIGTKNKMAMDSHPTTAGNKRVCALLGSLSGLGPTAMEKLVGPDSKTMELIGWLFANA